MRSGASGGNSSWRKSWWRRAFRSLGALSGLLAASGAATSGASAQEAAYRPAATAPAAWQNFARELQSRFEARLADDVADARAFQDYLKQRGSDAQPLTFTARTWILPDGRIERLEFDDLDDKQIAVHLRTLLTRGAVGAPPQDMLQPLRLRLSLRPNDRQKGDK